jgi:hypothetical protein
LVCKTADNIHAAITTNLQKGKTCKNPQVYDLKRGFLCDTSEDAASHKVTINEKKLTSHDKAGSVHRPCPD